MAFGWGPSVASTNLAVGAGNGRLLPAAVASSFGRRRRRRLHRSIVCIIVAFRLPLQLAVAE